MPEYHYARFVDPTWTGQTCEACGRNFHQSVHFVIEGRVSCGCDRGRAGVIGGFVSYEARRAFAAERQAAAWERIARALERG